MNNLQEKCFLNLTEHEWHAALKDEFHWITEFLISSQAQSEFHHIHFWRYIDRLFFKKVFYFKMPSQACWTKKSK